MNPCWYENLRKSKADEAVVKTPAGKLVVYRDSSKKREWRWRMIAPRGGKIVADSGEGYGRLSGLLTGLRRACLIGTATPTGEA